MHFNYFLKTNKQINKVKYAFLLFAAHLGLIDKKYQVSADFYVLAMKSLHVSDVRHATKKE